MQALSLRNAVALLCLSCLATLSGCSRDTSIGAQELDQRLARLEAKAMGGLVFIEGGTFTMGDFGAVGEDGIWRPFFPPNG